MKIARFTAILLAALFCLSSCATLVGEGSEITTGGGTPASPESSATDDITTEEDPPVTEMFSTMPNASLETLKYFDPTLSHKPTEYDLLSFLLDKRLVGLTGENILEREIPISELVARLGKPHSRGLPVSYSPWLVWYTENGLYIAAHYFPADDVPEDVKGLQRTFEYSLVWEIWFCKQENSPQPIPSYLFDKKSSTESESQADETTINLDFDAEAATAIANEEFAKRQADGYFQTIVFYDIYYVPEDNTWVAWYGVEPRIPGTTFYVAVSKTTGEIVRTWTSD